MDYHTSSCTNQAVKNVCIFVWMKTKATLILFLALIFSGCEKDEDVTTPPPTPPTPTPPPANTIAEFTMFNAGNYWIYENYTIDSNGAETLLAQIDSVYYKGDTTINGDSCHIMRNWWILPGDYYLKDSSGYLIWNGRAVFSTEVTNDTFYTHMDNDTATFGHAREAYRRVAALTSSVTVSAGTFSNVLEVTEALYVNPDTIPVLNPVIQRARYAKNIGKISEEYSFVGELISLHAKRERRLVRYHVN